MSELSIAGPAGAIRRPAVRYYGGKWRIAKWIISYFPAHECYVEPYGGAMSVLLQKRRSPLEIYNDLNEDVVTFFRILRAQPDELLRVLSLTPWSRAEYILAHEPTDDPLERARRFYILCWQGFGGGRARWRAGWRYQIRSGTLWKPSSISFTELGHLVPIVERLLGVQIECRDALEVIASCDSPTTLFYLDPPYVHSTRSKWKDVYQVEMDDDQHRHLAEVVHGLRGMALISGYPGELYRELYEAHGWVRLETQARSNGGGPRSMAVRTEALWISPRTLARLGPLFLAVEGAV